MDEKVVTSSSGEELGDRPELLRIEHPREHRAIEQALRRSPVAKERLPRADLERLLVSHPEPQRQIERAALDLVLSELPGAVVQVDFRNKGAITIDTEPKNRDFAFAILAHSAHVNLQLGDGADLPDPAGIIDGTGERIRHVKLRSLDDVSREAVRDLVRAQVFVRSSL